MNRLRQMLIQQLHPAGLPLSRHVLRMIGLGYSLVLTLIRLSSRIIALSRATSIVEFSVLSVAFSMASIASSVTFSILSVVALGLLCMVSLIACSISSVIFPRSPMTSLSVRFPSTISLMSSAVSFASWII